MPKSNCGWWRDYFDDHPDLITKQPEAYANIGTGEGLLQRDISNMQREDEDQALGNKPEISV
jgi:hypothetical protein